MLILDFTDKRTARRRKRILEVMENMEQGQSCVHDHSAYKTPFSTWLAQQRVRLRKNFKGEKLPGATPIYKITLAEEASEPVAA